MMKASTKIAGCMPYHVSNWSGSIPVGHVRWHFVLQKSFIPMTISADWPQRTRGRVAHPSGSRSDRWRIEQIPSWRTMGVVYCRKYGGERITIGSRQLDATRCEHTQDAMRRAGLLHTLFVLAVSSDSTRVVDITSHDTTRELGEVSSK